MTQAALRRLERISEAPVSSGQPPDPNANAAEKFHTLMRMAETYGTAVIEMRQALPDMIAVLRDVVARLERLEEKVGG